MVCILINYTILINTFQSSVSRTFEAATLIRLVEFFYFDSSRRAIS